MLPIYSSKDMSFESFELGYFTQAGSLLLRVTGPLVMEEGMQIYQGCGKGVRNSLFRDMGWNINISIQFQILTWKTTPPEENYSLINYLQSTLYLPSTVPDAGDIVETTQTKFLLPQSLHSGHRWEKTTKEKLIRKVPSFFL